jgi:phospholipase/carboxylesterase
MSLPPLDPPIEIETQPSPTHAVIWLHGLGADGNDFAPIIPQLALPADSAIRFIFPHAPQRPVTCNAGYVMRAWYDIYSLDSLDREDSKGLEQARDIVDTLIRREMARGIPPQRIVLMGFSQGGAVALYAGLRYPQTLAGIGGLSCYLPMQSTTAEQLHPANRHTPIFLAHGQYDPVVRYLLGERTYHWMQQNQLPVSWHEYAMEHSVCLEEIDDIAQWLGHCLSKDD